MPADPAASALLTDLYQLSMALGYWRAGRADQEAAFHLYFRNAPFGSGYTIACGLEPALDYLAGLRFEPAELEYLAGLRGADGAAEDGGCGVVDLESVPNPSRIRPPRSKRPASPRLQWPDSVSTPSRIR